MRGALSNVVTARANIINFGLMLYPSDSVCGTGNMQVGIMPANASAIVSRLTAVFPDGGTPTHTSLVAARLYFDSIPVNPNGRYVLLATDGEPNCRSASSPQTPTITESITAIQALASVGIKTYVLGFGDVAAADPTTLESMASAGGTGMFYAANSPAQLEAALNLISGQVSVPSCTYTLDSQPVDASKLAVSFDGSPVARSPSHADGWDYDAATNSITFYGAACAQVQSGAVTSVHVDYGCGGGPVIP